MTQNRFNKGALVIKCKFAIDHMSSYTVKMAHNAKAGQRNTAKEIMKMNCKSSVITFVFQILV
jgi:hypothetical protein